MKYLKALIPFILSGAIIGLFLGSPSEQRGICTLLGTILGVLIAIFVQVYKFQTGTTKDK